MIDIFKQKKILFGVMLVIVLAGAFTFIRLFIYDSYRMPDTASPGTTAISDGSTLTLDIPDSALPSGVTKDQMVVEPIPVSELPEDIQDIDVVAAFRLTPDGLTFKEPVSFSIKTILKNNALLIIFHISEGQVEVVDNVSVVFDGNNQATITGSIAHLSIITVGGGLLTIFMPNNMGSHFVGESFRVPVIFDLNLAVDERTGKEPYASFRLNPEVTSAGFRSFVSFAPVKPDYIEKMPAVDTQISSDPPPPRSLDVRGEFTCAAVGDGEIVYMVWVIREGYSWGSFSGPMNISYHVSLKTQVNCIEPESPSTPTPTITPTPTPTPTTTAPPTTPTPACTWTCGSWGACSSSGTQTRSCTSSPSPCTGTNPNPTSQTCKPSCNIPAFQACANTFSLQGCIDACPYVDAACPPSAPPDTDCKETDKVCSDACWSEADAHVDSCLASNNCTKEEVIAGGGGAQR